MGQIQFVIDTDSRSIKVQGPEDQLLAYALAMEEHTRGSVNENLVKRQIQDHLYGNGFARDNTYDHRLPQKNAFSPTTVLFFGKGQMMCEQHIPPTLLRDGPYIADEEDFHKMLSDVKQAALIYKNRQN